MHLQRIKGGSKCILTKSCFIQNNEITADTEIDYTTYLTLLKLFNTKDLKRLHFRNDFLRIKLFTELFFQ